MNVRKLVLLLVVSLCTACTALNIQNRSDKFELSLRQYGSALRWGHWTDAYSYHITRDKKQPEVDIEKLERFSIAGFGILEQIMDPEGTEVIILVDINYYDEQIGTLRNIRQQQVWWFNEETKRWLTESDFPDLK